MSIDTLLSRLERVKATGDGRWVALCPAHDDRSPSLSVRELDDGRVLAHCFGGCGVDSVLRAVGLEMDALFPENVVAHARPTRNPWSARDLIHLLHRESLVVLVAACDEIEGKSVSHETINRVMKARNRIAAIAEALP